MSCGPPYPLLTGLDGEVMWHEHDLYSAEVRRPKADDTGGFDTTHMTFETGGRYMPWWHTAFWFHGHSYAYTYIYLDGRTYLDSDGMAWEADRWWFSDRVTPRQAGTVRSALIRVNVEYNVTHEK